jgi:hypothetical protein
VGASACLCLFILLTARASTASLGVPPAWAWVLTGTQLLGLWVAGHQRPSGWLIGFVVQPGWIVYALLSGQLGFVPGCAVSAGVHLATFMRQRRERAGIGSTNALASFPHQAGGDWFESMDHDRSDQRRL